ncbi:MAG: ATP-binding protein [Nanoarchaeota archaeon]|nr:ATP-binding protein [Nanoarchaeota archaeon]
MEWYEELDFDENPLNTETRYIGNEIVLDEVFYSIVSNNILIIQGNQGSGKTKILKEVIKKYGGFGKVAFINCKKLEKELNIENVIKNQNGLIGRLLNKDPKNMILLLDDVENLTERNMERIKYYFDRNYLRSVIITTTDLESLNLNESIKQRVRKIITLKSLSDYEAVQVARDKLGENLLNDRIIKTTYHESDKNMKKFLNNCELVCKAYIANKDIKEEDVRKIITKEAK